MLAFRPMSAGGSASTVLRDTIYTTDGSIGIAVNSTIQPPTVSYRERRLQRLSSWSRQPVVLPRHLEGPHGNR